MDLFPWIAPLIGLASALHCFGMCGGIVGALTLCLPEPARSRPGAALPFLLAYNGGRIAAYVAAGALAGALGGAGSEAVEARWGAEVGGLARRALASAVLVTVGLHLAGWLPGLNALERLGAPLWRRISPLTRRLLPVASPGRALLYGLLWGWLPCGVVYSALLAAAVRGGAAEGALFMLLFGLGTLPALLAMGHFSAGLLRLARGAALRRAIGFGIIVAAAAQWWLM